MTPDLRRCSYSDTARSSTEDSNDTTSGHPQDGFGIETQGSTPAHYAKRQNVKVEERAQAYYLVVLEPD